MYHLYEKDEVNRAIDEAIRVTKPNRVILFAFLSVFAITGCKSRKSNTEMQPETPKMHVRDFINTL